MLRACALAAFILATPLVGMAQTPASPSPSAEASPDYRRAWFAYFHAQRAQHIDVLERYAERGTFIEAPEVNGYFHRFVDDRGHRCPVAELVWRSGDRELVQSTARDDNEVELATVRDGPLMEWILTSGLTQEEIATIQRPGDNSRMTQEFLAGIPAGRSYAEAVKASESKDAQETAVSAEFLESAATDGGAPISILPPPSPRPHLAAAVALLRANHDVSVAKAVHRLGDRVNAPPPSL
ncbi:MAG: hypothetical protein AB8H79_10330 [Myxococcota bacterium]